MQNPTRLDSYENWRLGQPASDLAKMSKYAAMPGNDANLAFATVAFRVRSANAESIHADSAIPDPKTQNIQKIQNPVMPEVCDSTAVQTTDVARRARLPAWLSSVVLHLILLLWAGLIWKPADPHGFPIRGDRQDGMLLGTVGTANTDRPDYFYFSSSGSESTAGGSTSGAGGALPNNLPAASGQLPGLPTSGAASAGGSSGRGGGSGIGLPSTGELTGFGQPGRGTGTGGQTSTGVFGAVGTGSKFIYVFDRSASMGDLGGRPLRAAKVQLVKSLELLSDVHQFQIVFYNEQPYVFNPNAPRQPRLMYGDDQSKRLAENFIDGISAIGGTQHWDALKLALGMRPGVVFFLTDGISNPLTKNQLEQIHRIHERVGTSINVIEFGNGSSSGRINFLKQLAQQNRGQYVYVDVTKLSLESMRH